MGQPTEAGLASIEPEGVYEHLAIGVLEEGYTLAYVPPSGVDTVKYDVYQSSSGITCVGSHICRDDRNELVKATESKTDDDLLTIRQTFIISKNETRVVVRMEITNCRRRESLDLTDFLSSATRTSMSTQAAVPAGRISGHAGTRTGTRCSATSWTGMPRKGKAPGGMS
jgi:hypothetical protein